MLITTDLSFHWYVFFIKLPNFGNKCAKQFELPTNRSLIWPQGRKKDQRKKVFFFFFFGSCSKLALIHSHKLVWFPWSGAENEASMLVARKTGTGRTISLCGKHRQLYRVVTAPSLRRICFFVFLQWALSP